MAVDTPSVAVGRDPALRPALRRDPSFATVRCTRCRDRPGGFDCCPDTRLCDLCLFSECADSARSLGMIRCSRCGGVWLDSDLAPHLRRSQVSDLLAACAAAVSAALMDRSVVGASNLDAEIARLRAELDALECRRATCGTPSVLRCERCLRVVQSGATRCGECEVPEPVAVGDPHPSNWRDFADPDPGGGEDADRLRAMFRTLTKDCVRELAACLMNVDPVFAASFDWTDLRRVAAIRIAGRVPPHLLILRNSGMARLTGKSEDAVRREVRSFEVTCQLDFRFAKVMQALIRDGLAAFAESDPSIARTRLESLIKAANEEFDAIGFAHRRKRYHIPTDGAAIKRVMYTHHANYLRAKRGATAAAEPD